MVCLLVIGFERADHNMAPSLHCSTYRAMPAQQDIAAFISKDN